ncbi:MAG: hypothetical protein IJS37_04955 [Bacilli bacterium]|nr:hypothetical protein [Bacilli bacterium]
MKKYLDIKGYQQFVDKGNVIFCVAGFSRGGCRSSHTKGGLFLDPAFWRERLLA